MAEDFFLSPDDSKTFGDIDYMRQPNTVKRTFPGTVNNGGSFAVTTQVNAMEQKVMDGGTGVAPKPATTTFINTWKPERKPAVPTPAPAVPTPAPVEPEVTASVEPEVTASVEPEATASVEPEATASVEPEVTASVATKAPTSNEPDFLKMAKGMRGSRR